MVTRVGGGYVLTREGKLRRKAPGNFVALKQRGKTKRGAKKIVSRAMALNFNAKLER